MGRGGGFLTRGLLVLVAVLLCALGAASAPALAADDPKYHSKVGPPDPVPKDFAEGGWNIGVDTNGKYCLLDAINDSSICALPDGGTGGGPKVCEGADGNASRDCGTPEDQKEFEKKRLEEWRKKTQDTKGWEHWDKLNEELTKCVEGGKPFSVCQKQWEGEYPPPGPSLSAWVAGKFSEFASDALKEAANYLGKSVVWLLHEFAQLFNQSSTIKLGDTGISKPLAIATTISAMLAAFLLILQFAKTAISQRGEAAGTAIGGLAKWAVITPVYIVFTQAALGLSDEISTWIINYTFTNGGEGSDAATAAMQEQFGKMFGGLIAGGGGGATASAVLISGATMESAAVGVVIVVGIICILAIGALWLELLLRQAGIMILCVTMPITLAGQISETTTEWWPKARNALITLIMMKPVIILCFSIGFFALGESSGVQNMIVGLLIFLLACFSWPALAKFMTFTTNGEGSSAFSGLMSSAGSSASGSARGDGAGSVGGGSGYTKALESEAAPSAVGPSGGAAGAAGGAAKKGVFAGAASVAAVGLQVAAVAKDTAESGMANTAANAGLGHGAPGGRHAVYAQRKPRPAAEPEAPPLEAGFVVVPPEPPKPAVRTSPFEKTEMADPSTFPTEP